jgi:hypothetical protein
MDETPKPVVALTSAADAVAPSPITAPALRPTFTAASDPVNTTAAQTAENDVTALIVRPSSPPAATAG